MDYDIDVELRAGSVLLSSAGLDDIPSFRSLWSRISEETSLHTLDSVAVEDVAVIRDGSRPALRLRVYSPLGAPAAKPALLMIHSGGFVAGSIETIHGEALQLASELAAVVVSVAYRLAPEHPYPAALEDCDAALAWMLEHADELGLDRARVALHGTSAGGGLAVATALRRLRSGALGPSFVYLNAPQLDDRLLTGSMREFTDTPCYTRRAASISWDSYLGDGERGGTDVPLLAAPGRATAEDLRGFPPTYVAVMEFDPLRDEAIRFGQALLEAGVPLELHLFPRTFHGSSVIAHAEVSQRETQEAVVVLRQQLRAEMW